LYSAAGLDLGVKLYFGGRQIAALDAHELSAVGPALLSLPVHDVAVGRGSTRQLGRCKVAFRPLFGMRGPHERCLWRCKAGSPSRQFLWEHSDEVQHSDRQSFKKRKIVSDGGAALAESESGNPTTRRGLPSEVQWDGIIVLIAAKCGHFDVARWLCEHTECDSENWDNWCVEGFVKRSLDGGADDLARLFLPRGMCVLDYAEDCSRVDMIELLLDCGCLHRDTDLVFNAIRNLAQSGSLALMQQIVLLHSPLPEGSFSLSSRWTRIWKEALRNACASGELEATRWLLEHPLGVAVCKFITQDQMIDDFTSAATENGHWQLLRFLCERKISNDYESLLRLAIELGHLKCVEVLIEQFVEAKTRPQYNPMDVAVKTGSIDTVVFLHNFTLNNAQASPGQDDVSPWWSQIPNSISTAAYSGNVELIKWLQSN
jgi:hypothetical protein